MKILHTESSIGWGGQEHRTLKEMRVLRARGHQMFLLVRPQADFIKRAEEEGFTVFKIPARNAWDPVAFCKTLALLKRENFDIVNTHSGHDSILAGLAARMAGVPLVIRTRHLALPVTSLFSYKHIAHRVITVSRWVEKYLVERGLPHNRVATIYTAIEPPPNIQQSTLRAELGLKDDDVLVATVAILRHEKGHKDLIEAARPLFERYPKLHLIFAGDGPIFEELKAFIAAFNLQKRIHLLGLRRDIPNVLKGCDFFALATHQEALGTSFIEAMAMGLPAIGTAVDGVPEVITDGKTGLLVAAHHPESLRNALIRLIESPDERNKMGESAQQDVLSRFGLDTMATNLENFYTQHLPPK